MEVIKCCVSSEWRSGNILGDLSVCKQNFNPTNGKWLNPNESLGSIHMKIEKIMSELRKVCGLIVIEKRSGSSASFYDSYTKYVHRYTHRKIYAKNKIHYIRRLSIQ